MHDTPPRGERCSITLCSYRSTTREPLAWLEISRVIPINSDVFLKMCRVYGYKFIPYNIGLIITGEKCVLHFNRQFKHEAVDFQVGIWSFLFIISVRLSLKNFTPRIATTITWCKLASTNKLQYLVNWNSLIVGMVEATETM